MSQHEFLVELGTEELPPKALRTLSEAFADGIKQGLTEAKLSFADIEPLAAPRRLAVRVTNLDAKQADQDETLYGPPANIAFDADGQPTKAAQGFATRAGVDVSELGVADNGKLVIERRIIGQPTVSLLPNIVKQSLSALPIPKRMRWGQERTEFIRPVHWLLMMLDDTVVPANILGLDAGNQTYGHRFHAPQAITVDSPQSYEAQLERAYVHVNFDKRAELIRTGVEAQGKALGATAIIDDELLEEVCALNEWPVPLAGSFDERFLHVAPEALISSMKEHQKYFHVVDSNHQLLPNFITVANIESTNPQAVIEGNEKVIRPRLADAAFFWETDRKHSLESRFDKLHQVVWVNTLGSLADKSERIERLAAKLADAIGADATLAARAGRLCKTDLVTHMVYEFTDLQGIAGQYYAQNDGEPSDVCAAMTEQYKPAFAGDDLPSTHTGVCVALADRLDSLVGLFGIGQIPSGSKDPFALRRASLGVLRILVEKKLPLDLSQIIGWAIDNEWPIALKDDTLTTLQAYMLDRFSAWYQDQQVATEVFQAVRATGVTVPLDIDQRVHAVNAFSQLDAAQALASANKRVGNILTKNASALSDQAVDARLLEESAEQTLAKQLDALQARVPDMIATADYAGALSALADLREPVDAFFDSVMVMVDNEAVMRNRLALLKQLQQLFMGIADISVLPQTNA